MQTENLKTHVLRLKPGEDLRGSIIAYVEKTGLQAAWIASCVGSLRSYGLRFANQNEPNRGTGFFEILGLTGTLSVHGSHIHAVISDDNGMTKGGHLVDGNLIYTTAEIVICQTDQFIFKRQPDKITGYRELQVLLGRE